MSDRVMAKIVQIDAINSIKDADAIEVASVGGWKVVVKKGEFSVGKLAVYCEIDSWIPTVLAPFLTKPGHFPKEFNGVEGEKLRTIRLRGQVSQGLLLPLTPDMIFGMTNILNSEEQFDGLVGQDLTEKLGIQKWEAPISAQLAGTVKGNFPSQIPKTDEERIQNLKKELETYKEFHWEVTEKLEGSSMTVYVLNGEFGVCSRNLDLKRDENNTFWATAIKLNLEEKLLKLGVDIALQGELIGPGIQDNIYKLTEHKFMLFDVYDIVGGKDYLPEQRWRLTDKLNIDHVPVLHEKFCIKDETMESLIKYADGTSNIGEHPQREGLVFKCVDRNLHFKVVSNKYLEKSKL